MKTHLRSLCSIVVLVLAGCATSPRTRIAAFSAYSEAHAELAPEDQARVDDNCPFGMPEPLRGVNLGPTVLVARDGYVLRHSSVDKEPLWVCEHVEAAETQGHLPRHDVFRPDPLLEEGARAELVDYRGSGLDRGHMAPAGDQTVDARLKDETFFLSNMAPQEPALNQRIWAALEDQAREWAKERGEAWIITGPMWYDPREDDPRTAKGYVEYDVIGPGEVAVPTHCYKIVVRPDGNGQFEAIGFVMKNASGYREPYDFAGAIRSVDWIEKRTGINFMPEIDAAERQRLELQAPALWP